MLESGKRTAGEGLAARLRALGLTLPVPPTPLGAYVPAVEVGSLLFVSGMLPRLEGKLVATGRFGENLSVAQGQEAAKVAVLNALAVAGKYLGDIDRIKGVVRVSASLKTTADFQDHASVADGASNFLAQLFDSTPGHVRTVQGVYSLPIGTPLTLEILFRLDDSSKDSDKEAIKVGVIL